MIYLIHGPDVVSSKNFLLKLRENYSVVEVISEKESRKGDRKLPTGQTLFQDKKLVILENFDLKNFKLPKTNDYDLVLWFDSVVSQIIKADKVWLFKEKNQVSSFKLADLVSYGREKQALETLNQLLRTKGEQELIIGSLVRQLKLITLVLKGETAEVSQSEYLKAKIVEQSRNWTLEKIRVGLLHLLKTDLLLKTGRASAETLLTNLTSTLARLAEN